MGGFVRIIFKDDVILFEVDMLSSSDLAFGGQYAEPFATFFGGVSFLFVEYAELFSVNVQILNLCGASDPE